MSLDHRVNLGKAFVIQPDASGNDAMSEIIKPLRWQRKSNGDCNVREKRVIDDPPAGGNGIVDVRRYPMPILLGNPGDHQKFLLHACYTFVGLSMNLVS
jgi:hypothetical protein